MQARMKRLVLDEVKGYFRPELLNRFDEQIVFHKLGLKEVRRLCVAYTIYMRVSLDSVPLFLC
jgi:ATP-dependent Clp protease ATP-binding subunit ClpA